MLRGVSNYLAYLTLAKGSQLKLDFNKLQDARFLIGILMHHDAITGTCTNNVARDYLRMAAEARSLLDEVARDTLAAHLGVTATLLGGQSVPVSETGGRYLLLNQDVAGSKTVRLEAGRPAIGRLGLSSAAGRWMCGLTCEVGVTMDFAAFESRALSVEVQAGEAEELREELADET